MSQPAARSIGTLLLIVCLAFGAGAIGARLASPAAAAQLPSVLERVQKTKQLRCAFWSWPGLIEKDPATQKVVGPFAELIEEVAKSLNATVAWTTEANIDDFIQLANANKVDAVCGPIIPAHFLRGGASFARPVLYASFDVYTRAKESRFAGTWSRLNTPETRILSLDGTAAKHFASTLFPKATQNSLPAMLGSGQVLLDVAEGKADATLSEQLTAQRFMDTHPDSLQRVREKDQPLITLGMTPFVTKIDDPVWTLTLNAILSDLDDFGITKGIFDKYGMKAGLHYRPIASPFAP